MTLRVGSDGNVAIVVPEMGKPGGKSFEKGNRLGSKRGVKTRKKRLTNWLRKQRAPKATRKVVNEGKESNEQ